MVQVVPLMPVGAAVSPAHHCFFPNTIGTPMKEAVRLRVQHEPAPTGVHQASLNPRPLDTQMPERAARAWAAVRWHVGSVAVVSAAAG
jgi:hypothetical protein